MKEFKDKLLGFLTLLIAVLLTPLILLTILIGCLIGLLRYPFCNAKYKKSYYFKDFGINYAAFVYDSEFYRIYNAVREADLPLKPLLCRDRKNRVIDLLFFHGDALLSVNTEVALGFDADQEQWMVEIFNDEIDGDETVEFIEYMNKQTDDMLSAHPDCPIPNRRVILVDKNLLQKHEIDRAMETPEFLLYDHKDPAKAIREWIEEN